MLSDRGGNMVLPLPLLPFEVLVVTAAAAPEGIMRLPVLIGADTRRGLGAMMMFSLSKRRETSKPTIDSGTTRTTRSAVGFVN